MNVVALMVGLMINMEETLVINYGHIVDNNRNVSYYIDLNINTNRVRIKYDNKFNYYYDLNSIVNFELKEKVNRCIEVLPGIPCQ